MSTTQEFIERIVELNPSADSRWLAEFGASELSAYLDRLELARSPRGSIRFGGGSGRRRGRREAA